MCNTPADQTATELRYRAKEEERKLSGVVLEVKGDLCRRLQVILNGCGRSQDYVEVS